MRFVGRMRFSVAGCGIPKGETCTSLLSFVLSSLAKHAVVAVRVLQSSAFSTPHLL